jgi:alkylation response protein AidB-like acyl-CoA dehydrogenase
VRLDVNAEQRLFRQQVRAHLADPPVRQAIAALRARPGTDPDVRLLYRELGRRGLLAVNWPVEYGGQGRDLLDAAVVAEELARAGVPDTLYVNTIQIVGLFLLMAGTPEQRARHLPPLARGERSASVLYTEPGSGSDLGSLSTMAVRDPDGGWRLTGVKAYNLKSDLTDIGLCAARTGPPESRYDGISLFLVDLHAPGVRRSVIGSIADEQFHRVELDGVRVGPADLLGEENGGWPLLTRALAVERTGLDYSLKAEVWLGAAARVLGPQVDEAALEEIGRYGAAVDASRLLSWQVLTGLAADRLDEGLAAASKFYSGELASRIGRWAGLRLPGSGGDRLLPADAAVLEAAYREAPGLTLAAGTSEMMLEIVANLVLDGLEQEARTG